MQKCGDSIHDAAIDAVVEWEPLSKIMGNRKTSEAEAASRRVKEAMASLAGSATAAFDEMMTNSQHVVDTESSADKFLRYAQDDAFSAAKRICKYWEMRKAHFGDRASLPMTATGSGALSKNDLEVFQSGFIVLLPNDRLNRPVVCYDRSRLEEDFESIGPLMENIFRCVFYVLSIASDFPISQSEGVVFLEVNHSSFKPMDTDKVFGKWVEDILRSVIPVRRKLTAVIFKPPRIGRQIYMDNVFPAAIKGIKRRLAGSAYTLHVNNSKGKLLELLTKQGFTKEGLPVAIGGTLKLATRTIPTLWYSYSVLFIE
jgi:hypothetical protein